ncbi:MAG: rare lipoprotein [Solirubrobacteraceae bacterium]|jgi:hypothetical protein|nr:rare lipoprotein [Solirubrobacteraceae bacterium]
MGTRTTTATLVAALGLSAAVGLPCAASAASGDPAYGGTAAPDRGSAATPTTGATAPGSAAPGGLKAGSGALLGRRQRVTGTMAGVEQGGTVLLQRSDGSGWVTVARATAGRAGAFTATWRADRVGRFTLRAIPGDGTAARTASATPTALTTVYGAAIATHYGEGSYGSRTACGVTLTPRTVGVAHKTLPCGTMVEFYYRGRTVRAPVIDRGPYANNAAWDLTMAASRALSFSGLDYVGAMRVGRVTLRRAG